MSIQKPLSSPSTESPALGESHRVNKRMGNTTAAEGSLAEFRKGHLSEEVMDIRLATG
ncbi:hypothetical protein I79_011690 [Cricetulus griseus]|uniref:Uncharacterized protein n=1 Tax=Cricetulus griseus TaxID=10029 RepID=G3HLU6_CRIGR|nr:hypothetical protein I79_011690 [Cricetulus griseus]